MKLTSTAKSTSSPQYMFVAPWIKVLTHHWPKGLTEVRFQQELVQIQVIGEYTKQGSPCTTGGILTGDATEGSSNEIIPYMVWHLVQSLSKTWQIPNIIETSRLKIGIGNPAMQINEQLQNFDSTSMYSATAFVNNSLGRGGTNEHDIKWHTKW